LKNGLAKTSNNCGAVGADLPPRSSLSAFTTILIRGNVCVAAGQFVLRFARRLEALEASDMQQEKGGHSIKTTAELKELERLRSRARHNEASALDHARQKEREKWQGIVAEIVAEKDARIAEKDAVLAEKDARIAEKDAVLAEKEALIAELEKRLGENKQ
jgi:hypothetical protein